MSGKKILIMSGTSEIAEELAKLYLTTRNTLLIHGRNEKKLNQLVAALSKINPEASVIALPTINLINPRVDKEIEKDFESIYDHFYESWFDNLVQEYGLPSYMIVAGGGSGSTASATLELNTVSAMKCCENFIRKIREHSHNDKYKNKTFRILYMNSFLGERPDLWEHATIYSQAKRCMKEYLNYLQNNLKDINLRVHNAIIGPVDTRMLQGFNKKIDFSKMGPLESMFYKGSMFLLPIITSSSAQAAIHIKNGVESDKSEFFVPPFLAYMPYMMDFVPNLLNFVLNGVIFTMLFIPTYRNYIFTWFKKIFRFW